MGDTNVYNDNRRVIDNFNFKRVKIGFMRNETLSTYFLGGGGGQGIPALNRQGMSNFSSEYINKNATIHSYLNNLFYLRWLISVAHSTYVPITFVVNLKRYTLRNLT